MDAARDLGPHPIGRHCHAQVAEVARPVGLDLVPGQHNPLPARPHFGHQDGVLKAFGDAEPRVERRLRVLRWYFAGNRHVGSRHRGGGQLWIGFGGRGRGVRPIRGWRRLERTRE